VLAATPPKPWPKPPKTLSIFDWERVVICPDLKLSSHGDIEVVNVFTYNHGFVVVPPPEMGTLWLTILDVSLGIGLSNGSGLSTSSWAKVPFTINDWK